MNETSSPQAQDLIRRAYQALRTNNRLEARQLASEAAKLAPNLEDPWLILAALAGPQASVEYLKRALEINPASTRAQKGLEWANQRSAAAPAEVPAAVEAASPAVPAAVPLTPPPPEPPVEHTAPVRVAVPAAMPEPVPAPPTAFTPPPEAKPLSAPAAVSMPAPAGAAAPAAQPAAARKPSRLAIGGWVAGLVVLVCLAVGGAWLGWSMINGVFAQSPSAQRPVGVLQKPSATFTATFTSTFTSTATWTATATRTLIPSATATQTQTASPTLPPTLTPSLTALPTKTLKPAPTRTPGPTEAAPSTNKLPTNIQADQHWIDVDLSRQRAYAYQGSQLVRSFVVSTGIAVYPTVTGQYHVYVRYRYADMAGIGWYLKNVPYVMYFYKGYGLHGTYWHNNFGTPMSHGCVNFKIEDAAWVYDFTTIGTLVNIHY